MHFYRNLHEQYFLNTIKKNLAHKKSNNEKEKKNGENINVDANAYINMDIPDKLDSVFLSGVFWVLSGLLIINKNRNNLSSLLTEEVTDNIYKLVMKCMGKKKIKKNFLLNSKKANLFLSTEDIEKLKEKEQKNLEHIKENENIKIKTQNEENRKENEKKIEKEELKKAEINSEKKKKKKKIIICGFSSCHKKFFFEPDIISTLSAIQILFLLNKVSEEYLCTELILQIYNFVQYIYNEENGFFYFSYKSVKYNYPADARYMFCSLSLLYILNILIKKRNISIKKKEQTAKKEISPNNNSFIYNSFSFGIDKTKCVHWLMNCFNFDGGFSSLPGGESHAGTTFCAIHSLNILTDEKGKNYFSHRQILRKRLIRWLCDRCNNFGFNGRVGKDNDVCYAWWVISSLIGLGIDLTNCFNIDIALKFILNCQDKHNGGFSRIEQFEETNNSTNKLNYIFKFSVDTTHIHTDEFHTFFSLCALSLIHQNVVSQMKKRKKRIKQEENCFFNTLGFTKNIIKEINSLQHIHPAFAMPIYTLD